MYGGCISERTWAVARRLPVGATRDVLAMLAICPESADLLETVPALALCLASGFVLEEAKTGAWPVGWFQQKRRELARRCGFPGEERTLRLLAKIRVEVVSLHLLRQLRGCLYDPDVMKRLCHLSVIEAGHIAAATALTPMRLVSRRLFREVAMPSWYAQADRHGATLADTIWLLEHVGERVQMFASLRHLLRTHERLARQTGFSGPSDADPKKVLFPPPPVAALPGVIEPILSAFELEEEGRSMEHCVARYRSEVLAQRRSYFYRLLTPERGTIALRKKGGRWVLHMCRARANRRLSNEALTLVEHWLERLGDADAPDQFRNVHE